MSAIAPTALIAEDEPLLARALQAELARAWPQLQLVATVGDGAAAVREALALRPRVLFLDIRMPGLSGLEAAQQLAEDWPEGPGAPPFPAIVFVTAYDQYALAAFEAQAADYLLKPVQPQRLARCVAKLQQLLAAPAEGTLESTLAQLRGLLAPSAAPAPLRMIQAAVGTTIRLVPVDEVLVFEAADKYVRVLTAGQELLIRLPLKELLPQLDAQRFWQVHRGTVVRADAIETVRRDDTGRLTLQLRGRAERWPVSRLYAHLFRAM
jgi:DNA-binding LytR/AlgR family response regulator